MNRLSNSGRVLLYSLEMELITNKAYRCVRDRDDIVYTWRRRYPTLGFYIIIQPDINIAQYYED